MTMHCTCLTRLVVSGTELSNVRTYAIMSRAKQRAGIPMHLIKPKNKPLIPRKQPSSATYEEKVEEKPSGWKKAGLAKRSIERRQIFEEMSNQTVDRVALGPPRVLERLQQPRQPAGLAERLVKITHTINQPENPHLLRVAVVGAANAGKSTLVNAIVGEDISVVSQKAHTTRDRVLAVLTNENHQVVFLDTPGVVPDNRHAKMNRTLVTSSWRSLDEADHVVLLVDGSWATSTQEKKADMLLLERLSEMKLPTTLIFNKMDLLGYNDEDLEQVSQTYQSLCPSITKTLYVSALKNNGLDTVKKELFVATKPRPWIYPSEQKSDMPDLKRAEELIRVEFFKRLHQYIPYMLKQENVGWTELPDGTLQIDQNVYVERESQQRIVVGSNGVIINRVVADARMQIARAFKRPVKLFIQVKTRKR